MRAIRCVSGESSKCGCTLTLMNDLSRQCPTHAQLPLYPGEGQPVCVCVSESEWEGGQTGVIFACVLVCVGVRSCRIHAAECVLFWQPLVTHVNGMA